MAKIELAPQEGRNAEAGSAAPPELDDSAESLQARSTEHEIPAGITALFAGLAAWGLYYFVAFIGWDQTSDVKGGATLSTNIAHTIAYTAIPAAAIGVLAVAMARRKGGKR